MKQKVQINDAGTRRLILLAEQLADVLRVRPNSGRLWLDALYLILIGALHLSILPSLSHSVVDVDLMTPWLVVSFVTQTFPRATILGLIGALIIETHSAAPAGLYMCSYWVILVTLVLVRSPISWRHRFPWIVTFALTELWVIVFECFVLGINHGAVPFDWRFVSAQLMRILLAVGFGLLLVRRWLNMDPSLFEEEEKLL